MIDRTDIFDKKKVLTGQIIQSYMYQFLSVSVPAKLLRYCRYGMKTPINQSINLSWVFIIRIHCMLKSFMIYFYKYDCAFCIEEWVVLQYQNISSNAL